MTSMTKSMFAQSHPRPPSGPSRQAKDDLAHVDEQLLVTPHNDPTGLGQSVTQALDADERARTAARLATEAAVKVERAFFALRARQANTRGLTPRQSDILPLLFEGQPVKSVAKKLGLHFSTIEKHITVLLAKTGTHNVRALIYYALRCGWLTPPPRHVD